MENRKELIKKFRSVVSGGKPSSREFHLAYGFVRGIPYSALEKVINEDKFERKPEWPKYQMGVFSFLSTLAYLVSRVLWDIDDPDHPHSYQQGPLRDEIYNWMVEKYREKEAKENVAEESAA
jgi:hypothetical protein